MRFPVFNLFRRPASPPPIAVLPQPRVPFLPAVQEEIDAMNPAILRPATCACGAALEMELERDLGECVDCSYKAAIAGWRGDR